jgi:hypothetical protein
MFLLGRVATGDGTPVPHDLLVERVCNAKVRQQVYATSLGDFSMQMGSMADSYLDASGDRPSEAGLAGKNSWMGIPRHELVNCELRASGSGFHSRIISLAEFTDFGTKSIDVGTIVVERGTKVEGGTLSAIPYKAPKDARKAYEKGLEAAKNGNLASAQQYFEKAVKIYPRFTNAWFQLGSVLLKEDQKDTARTAFTQATSIDAKYLPPYLSLAVIAYQAQNWTEVVNLTGHILDLDPLNHLSGYILDLDPLNYTEAYFYNSVANYKLNKMEDAEKSGLKAEHLDLRTRFPQVHLLLAKIFALKNNYPAAILEVQTYLELVPHAKDVDQLRQWLEELQRLDGSVSAS